MAIRVGIAVVFVCGCNCGPTGIRSRLQSETATMTDLAFDDAASEGRPAFGLSHATPGHELDGDEIVFAMRSCRAAPESSDGRASSSARQAHRPGRVDVELTIFYPHLPALTRIDATFRGTVESDDLWAELLREALARRRVEP